MSQRSVVPKHAVYVSRPPLKRPAARIHARPMVAMGATQPPRRAVQGQGMPIARPTPRKVGSPIRVRAPRQVTASPLVARPATKRFALGWRRLGAALAVLSPAAVLLCVLTLAFASLVLGLSALLGQTLRGEVERGAFLLLAGGTVLVLLRGQVSVDRYWSLRRRLKLVSGHWTDHALSVLYALALFFAVVIVSTLLAAGGALLVGGLLR